MNGNVISYGKFVTYIDTPINSWHQQRSTGGYPYKAIPLQSCNTLTYAQIAHWSIFKNGRDANFEIENLKN